MVPQPARAREFALRHPRLAVPETLVPLDEAAAKPTAVTADAAFYDPHAQRWASLLLHEPLIPGRGVGNTLAWPAFGIAGGPTTAEIEAVAWASLREYVRRTTALRIDLEQLSPSPRVTVHDGGRLVQIHVQRTLAGVPVRDSALAAVVNHGNLVLLGLSHWADAVPAPEPDLDAGAARAIVAAHVEGAFVANATPRLEYVPFARQPPAEGYDLRLMWVVEGRIEGDVGSWEGLVDAAGGELLAFEDRNHHAQPAKVVGGVYPVSNDGLPPDGVEQLGFPMPFADVRLPDGSRVFTNSNGVIGCVNPSGRALVPSISTTLAGRYVTISDACGPVNERWRLRSPTAGDLGSGPGTDCAVPPGRHSPGDTHAARTSFYELNRIGEQARGYLPSNTWLQSPLPVNVNPPQTCGAFWNGSALNFFRSGAGLCRNPGEIAGVLDHEWGHGMDDNGADPTISNPAEAIADIHAILRLDESCVGRGFLQQGTCGGYGDPCTSCTGVRDLDWANHQSGLPHDIAWVQSRCPSGTGPCGRQVHCSSVVVSEAVWDLRTRDLPTLFGLDDNTALELTTRLVYLGGGMVGTWYQCTPPNAGCSATGGYLSLLAADDDNGNIADGTPHMTAIHSAFNRHQIACNVPAVLNSGCAGGPATAPTLAATPQDGGAALSWTAVPGAARYAVYRTEGVRGCAFGKTRLAETTGTSFVDLGLMNGFAYLYGVLPIGASGSCFGAMSTCETATPSGPGPCTPVASPSK